MSLEKGKKIMSCNCYVCWRHCKR